MAATIVAAAIAAGVGIYGAVKGAKQKKEAKRLAEQNKRPAYRTPQSEYDTLALLQSRASQGLSDTTRDAAMRNYNKGLSASINAILQSGGTPADITKAYAAYGDGLNNLALNDDAARIRNINMLIAQNAKMADRADTEFQVNKYAPYADNKALAAQMYAQGDQQMMSGLNTAAGGVSSAVGGAIRMAQTNKVGSGNGTTDMNSSMTSDPSLGLSANYRNTGSPYGSGNSSMMSIYDAKSNSYIPTLDWTRVPAQRRQNWYMLMNGS